MAAPVQKGTQLIFKAPPTFTAFIPKDGTWKETDPAAMEETMDGNSESINLAFSNPGIDAECEWVIKSASTPAAKGDEVTATYPADVTVKFHVVDVTTNYLGGKPATQNVKLHHRDSMTYSV